VKIAVVVMVGMVAASTCAFAAEPNLVGTWTGQRERIAKVEGYTKGELSLIVTEQNGRTFTGHLRRTYSGSADIDEDFWGAFTPDGHLIVGADLEGTYAFSLVDANTLDYCYTEAGPKVRAVCARLTRRP
jgi:hypothetical protein